MRFVANRRRRLLSAACAIAASISLVSCGQAPAVSPPVANSGSVVSASTAAGGGGGTVPHGDHNPHHGGVVLMKGDLHYEVVLDPAGRAHHLYFTDAVREDLPASVASDVGLTIRRPSLPDERIEMQIDEAGESWVGSGQAVSSQAATTARVAFSIGREPYWIDIPFSRP
jgi:hypothetical protein